MSRSPEPSGPRLLGGSEALLAGGLALVALAITAADGAGALLCGRIVAPKAAARVLLEALRGSAALAWPGNGEALSRTAFLVLFGAITSVLAVAAIATGRALHVRGHDEAGFASTSELESTASLRAALRAATVTRPSLERKAAGPEQLGYPLGVSMRPRGVRLVASWEHSLQVVAPPGAGKTMRVLGPILRQHPGPALATSTKPDLYEVSLLARRRVGPVVALDPERLCPGAEPLRWSPVAGCVDTRVAERRASALVSAAGDGSDVRGGAFFRRSAAAVLAAYLHAAALEGATMREVLAWTARPKDPAPLRALVATGDRTVDWAARLSAHTTGAEETTSGVMRTVDLALGCFADPDVLAACAIAPDEGVDLAALLEARGTLFALGKDRGALGGNAPLVTALCDELLTTAEGLAATRTGRRLDPPLLVCLDEAASIAPLPNLPALLADGRGRGITTVVALQSFSQAEHRWGREGARTIRNAASILLVFGGLAVASDLEELSRLAGTRKVERASLSSDGRSRSSRSVQLVDEPVLTSAEIHALGSGEALCLWGRVPPVLVRLPALFEGRGVKAVAVEEAAARAANDAARRGSESPDHKVHKEGTENKEERPVTDVEMVRCELDRKDSLPRCWRGAARGLEGIPFREDVRPWNWLELNEHEAEKLWAYLGEFVSFFNARYGERSANRIPPCWALHGPVTEEVTTLAFARWQAFSSAHASIGGAQYFHAYTLPAFYERLRGWLGNDLLTCQQGHHQERDDEDGYGLEDWWRTTLELRDEDLWLRLDADESDEAALPSLVPFVDRRPQ